MRTCMYLAVCLMLVPVLSAEEEPSWPISWGIHVEGPPVTAEDLPGRALLLVMWDEDVDNVEWIRKISPIRKRYGDKLLIIASHWRDRDFQGMLDAWSLVEGGEHVTLMMDTHMHGDNRLARAADELDRHRGWRGGSRRGQTLGEKINYEQACLLFDHEGRLVVQDDIVAVSRLIPGVYEAAPGHLAQGREWDQFADQAELLGAAERNMGGALAELREVLGGADLGAMAEAQALFDRVDAWSKRQLATAERLRTLDATACSLLLKRMCAWLKGDALGEPFRALAEELDDDKTFQLTLRAEAVLRALREDARVMDLSDRPEEAKQNKSYHRRLRRIEKTCRDIIENLPESAVAEQAEAMLQAYRL